MGTSRQRTVRVDGPGLDIEGPGDGRIPEQSAMLAAELKVVLDDPAIDAIDCPPLNLSHKNLAKRTAAELLFILKAEGAVCPNSD